MKKKTMTRKTSKKKPALGTLLKNRKSKKGFDPSPIVPGTGLIK